VIIIAIVIHAVQRRVLVRMHELQNCVHCTLLQSSTFCGWYLHPQSTCGMHLRQIAPSNFGLDCLSINCLKLSRRRFFCRRQGSCLCSGCSCFSFHQTGFVCWSCRKCPSYSMRRQCSIALLQSRSMPMRPIRTQRHICQCWRSCRGFGTCRVQ